MTVKELKTMTKTQIMNFIRDSLKFEYGVLECIRVY